MSVRTVPFQGTPPDVHEGQAVWCRTAYNTWALMVATGEPHYDKANAIGGLCHLAVPVVTPGQWETGRGSSTNWPAEDVTTGTEAPGPVDSLEARALVRRTATPDHPYGATA